MDPFVEEKEEDIKRLKNIQLELHADFIKVVENSRGSKLKDPEKNNIFTGEFWTGKTALKLGLIDGIGNAEQVLKEKFGEKVVIKNFEKRKGFLAKKLSSSISEPIDKIIGELEEKSMWQKFGFINAKKKLKFLTFQDIIMNLQKFWGRYGCILLQPYDLEVGAGTFHPATTLRSLGPKPWKAAYVQPSRRPTDGRYGENPNRLQHYYQYQVINKPSPNNIKQVF